MISSNHNKISIGFSASRSLLISEEIMEKFKELSDDSNPLHTDVNYAVSKGFDNRVAYGNLLGAMISALVGMNLGTPNVMLISQSINFRKPIYVGEKVTLSAIVSSFSEAVGVVEIDLTFSSSSSSKVATGKCQVKLT